MDYIINIPWYRVLKKGGGTMGRFSDSELFDLLKRARINYSLHDVEDLLIPSDVKQTYANQIHEISKELNRRGYAVPA